MFDGEVLAFAGVALVLSVTQLAGGVYLVYLGVQTLLALRRGR